MLIKPLKGYIQTLNSQERNTGKDIKDYLNLFGDNERMVFVFNRKEVKLNGMRHSYKDGEVRFLLKEV